MTVTGTPPGRRRKASLEFLEDCEISEQPEPALVSRPESLKRVKVLAPFSVSYHGIAYWADATPEVPASVADHWLRNRWVTEV